MKRILLLAASFFLVMGMSAQERRADGTGYERKVVVEELTGTACGWCPRGLVGMKMLRDLYGDRFIGVAVHQFNATDPMYTPDYADIDWSDGGSKGAPCCMIDRNGEIIDPFYGSAGGMRDVAKDFERAMEEKAVLGVTVSGEWNADYTAVQTTAQVEGTEAGHYEMVFVLVADSVAGNTQRCVSSTTIVAIPATVSTTTCWLPSSRMDPTVSRATTVSISSRMYWWVVLIRTKAHSIVRT